MPTTPAPPTRMRAVLVHGMGRTPLSMLLLARRLRAKGFEPALFGYCAAIESWDACCARLRRFIERHAPDANFVVVGHSLGCVLLRAVVAELEIKPQACFFLAPPSCACKAAQRLSRSLPYRLLTGEMGQLLANVEFMQSLPAPEVPTLIYAGSGGPRGRWSPFGDELNDGILAVSETSIGDVPMQIVPAIHTLIMNSTSVAQPMVEQMRDATDALQQRPSSALTPQGLSI